jgi:two-component SAPR family response regulator
MIPQHDHHLRALAFMALAKSEGFLTGMDRGYELANASLKEARLLSGNISKRNLANLLRSLGHICWWHGDPEAAIRYCQEALTLVSEESPTAAIIYITMATPYVYRQDFNTAKKYAEKGLKIAKQLQLAELLPRAHANLGSILSREEDKLAGEKHLRQAVELAQGLGLESYARVMAIGYLAQNLCSQGRIGEARQLAESVLWEQASNPNTYEMVVTRSVLADIALESNHLEEAQAIFESLEKISKRRQFRIPLAMIYFGLAYIQLKKGESNQAIHYAKRSVTILEPLKTWQLFLDQGERAQMVCQLLLQAKANTPFVDEVLSRIMPPSSKSVTQRENIVRVQCLGQFRVFINDQEIGQNDWVSTKARDMLAYFITFRDERIPLEKATLEIWPEQDQQGRAFHSALYRLRHALRQNTKKTKFIQVESGEYWLDKDQFEVDVDQFETAVNTLAHVPLTEVPYLRQKAIALYHGDYMSNLLYYDWANLERNRLLDKYVELLTLAANDQAQDKNYNAAIDLMLQAIEHDSLQEQFYCLTMDYYAASNNRSGLIRCYQTLTRELMNAFNLPPSPSSTQHYQKLIALL